MSLPIRGMPPMPCRCIGPRARIHSLDAIKAASKAFLFALMSMVPEVRDQRIISLLCVPANLLLTLFRHSGVVRMENVFPLQPVQPTTN